MKRFVMSTLIMTLLISPFAFSVSAQSVPTLPPLAAITNGNLTIYPADGSPITVDTSLQYYFDLAWSPDGQRLAYVGADTERRIFLRVTDTTGSPPITLTENAWLQFPLNFTVDSQNIIYVVITPEYIENTPDGIFEVMMQGLTADSTPQALGRFPFGSGCGGGSSFPGDQVYADEGGGFLGYELIFKPVPGGFIFSRDCVPSTTAFLDTFSGEVRPYAEPMRETVLSPDGSELAGTQQGGTTMFGNVLVIQSVDGQSSQILNTVKPVEGVAWSMDGTALYYSWRQEMELGLPIPQDFANMMGFMEPEIPLWEVGISRVDRADGSETQLYSMSATAIGRLIPLSNNTLVFSVVPGPEAWAQSIVEGTQPPTGDPISSFFPVGLYSLNLVDMTTSMIGNDLAQATVNIALVGQ